MSSECRAGPGQQTNGRKHQRVNGKRPTLVYGTDVTRVRSSVRRYYD
jgi:hypothetical protein